LAAYLSVFRALQSPRLSDVTTPGLTGPLLRDNSGGIVSLSLLPRQRGRVTFWFLSSPALGRTFSRPFPGLSLAALEVFPQGRRQPLLADRLCIAFDGAGHAARLRHTWPCGKDRRISGLHLTLARRI
jgi:hypothetical protein